MRAACLGVVRSDSHVQNVYDEEVVNISKLYGNLTSTL